MSKLNATRLRPALLMTVGTVGEKIAAMQARKRELVEGLLDEERRENLKLTPEDLDVLFAPLQ